MSDHTPTGTEKRYVGTDLASIVSILCDSDPPCSDCMDTAIHMREQGFGIIKVDDSGQPTSEALAAIPAVQALQRDNDRLRRQLRLLVTFADDHHCGRTEHDHDCYERWCIERDHTRHLLLTKGNTDD